MAGPGDNFCKAFEEEKHDASAKVLQKLSQYRKTTNLLYLFRYETIDTHARSFLSLIILAIASVNRYKISPQLV